VPRGDGPIVGWSLPSSLMVYPNAMGFPAALTPSMLTFPRLPRSRLTLRRRTRINFDLQRRASRTPQWILCANNNPAGSECEEQDRKMLHQSFHVNASSGHSSVIC